MSEQTKDGGQAFPITREEWDMDSDRWRVESSGGMTLRDYFAIRCLPISRQTFPNGIDGGWEALAEHAYALADEMLKARQS